MQLFGLDVILLCCVTDSLNRLHVCLLPSNCSPVLLLLLLATRLAADRQTALMALEQEQEKEREERRKGKEGAKTDRQTEWK